MHYNDNFVGEQYRSIKDVEYVDVHNEGLALCLLTKAMYVIFHRYYTRAVNIDGDDFEIPKRLCVLLSPCFSSTCFAVH